MIDLLPVLIQSGCLVFGYVFAQWIASLWFRDASLVDRYWGGGFALVAAATLVLAYPGGWRGPVIAGMAVIWGLRLSAYLTWRNWDAGEDYRYRAMRERRGAAFWWQSLFTVFLLQGALTWFISLPLQIGIAAGGPAEWTLLDLVGVALWIGGLTFESVGDYQLARFKADPARAGRVMDRGLWKYTRHPNYFGDAMVWWGMYLVAASTGAGAFTVLSPLLMHIFLMRVSGVVLLEKKLVKSRAGYAEYVARTNAFYPWFPRKPT